MPSNPKPFYHGWKLCDNQSWSFLDENKLIQIRNEKFSTQTC